MIKNILKKLTKILPENIRVRLHNLIYDTLEDKMPKFNMFYHIQLLKKIGFCPSFIVDIGGYEGTWTSNTKTIFPSVSFLIVEAQKSKKDLLDNLFSSDNQVSVECCLLGDTEKEMVPFFEMETGSSIYEENSNHDRFLNFLEMKTLDNIINKYDTGNNIFLKIDVQGAEIDVLKGATKTLESTEIILLEVSTLNYNSHAPVFNEIIKFMNEIDFSVFDICDQSRKENNVLFQLDIIFIRNTSEIRNLENFTKKDM